MDKLIALRDVAGGDTGRKIDLSTGYVYDGAGNTVDKWEADRELDAALSDHAAHHYYRSVSGQVGRPVQMRDASGDGVLVTMDLGPGSVHIDSALPNYAAGYKLEEPVADIACPVVMSPKESDYFNTWDSSNAFKRVIPIGAGHGGSVPEINPTLSNTQYKTLPYALACFVSTETEANADAPLRPYQAGVTRVMNALTLEREIRVANLMTTSGSYASANVVALAAAAKWNGGASSDPIANLHAVMEASYKRVTRIIMGRQVRNAWVRNPNVQKYFSMKEAGGKGIPSNDQLSAILDLPPITTAEMKYDVSGTATWVWGGSVVLIHEPPVNPPVDQEEVATAYTFRWNGGVAPDGSTASGWTVRTFFDPKRGPRGGRTVIVCHNDIEVMTSTIVGGLITGAYA